MSSVVEMKKTHSREGTNRQWLQMEFGQWSEISYCEDRQDFVHKLEFEVSTGETGNGVTSVRSSPLTFSPRRHG